MYLAKSFYGDQSDAWLISPAFQIEAGKKYSQLSFIESNSPIQGILIGDNFKAKALANHLIANGFFVRAILSPTVPIGKERLRICLHSFNTTNEIDALLSLIHTFQTEP